MNKEKNDQYQIKFTTGAAKDLKSKACKPYLKEIFKQKQHQIARKSPETV